MISNQKILVTGSNGQLGSELQDIASNFEQFEFVFLDREQFPIHDEDVVQKLLRNQKPQYLINCAAYTAVDQSELEIEESNKINGTAVGYLAKHCSLNQTKFIHISTDYVFNGKQQEPVKETEPVDPVNQYGRSKLLGEQLAFENNKELILIRTSWVYSSYGKNFVKTMLKLMNERTSVKVVNDQHGSPTYAADLAEAIMKVVAYPRWIPGIYHYSNGGVATWFEFASAIKEYAGFKCTVDPIPSSAFPTPAKRPSWSVLDTSKIRTSFGVEIYDWKKSLEVCMRKLGY